MKCPKCGETKKVCRTHLGGAFCMNESAHPGYYHGSYASFCFKNSNQQASVSGISKSQNSSESKSGNVSPPRPVKHK